jgi:hypothetical protein
MGCLWTCFLPLHGILSTVDQNVPSKVIKKKNHIPWLNRSLKRMLRRKARLHKHAKRAVYIVVNVLCNFSDVGFDFLPVCFGEDISLLWLLFTVVWCNHRVGDDDIVVRDSRCISLTSSALDHSTTSTIYIQLSENTKTVSVSFSTLHCNT